MPSKIQSLKQEKGITGLETAIILIAFVIVASVLSYVVISAGLFSSQKAKTAVNSSLSQAGSTIELKGNVVAEIDGTTSEVNTISFTVGVVPGGVAVDLLPNSELDSGTGTAYIPGGTEVTAIPATPYNNSMIITYQDSAVQVPNMYFSLSYINSNNGDDMLDPGELAMVTVYMDKALYPDMAAGLSAGETFTLSLTPPDGSVLPIERTMPKRTSGMVNLY